MYKCYSIVLYEETACPKCGCVEFKPTGEVLDSFEEHKGQLFSLGMTRQYAQDHLTGVQYICHCEDEDYVQVHLKGYSTVFTNDSFERDGWISIAGLEEQSPKKCPHCGNEEGLQFEIDSRVDSSLMHQICPRCRSINEIKI
ncbi:MAG: hypothetical protein Q8930_15245 [Bacillota bacterium]|nr:hypothetical protein [Bacillota bacterium]